MKYKKCYVCNGTKPSIFANRCEEHDVCLKCGVKRKNLKEGVLTRFARGGFICDNCHKKRIKEKIESFQAERKINEQETDEIYDDVIVCPQCGERHEADYERSAFYNEGYHEFTCADCNYVFNVETYISYNYTTSKIKEV